MELFNSYAPGPGTSFFELLLLLPFSDGDRESRNKLSDTSYAPGPGDVIVDLIGVLDESEYFEPSPMDDLKL